MTSISEPSFEEQRPQNDKLLTIEDVRGLLGVNASTVYRWIAKSGFPPGMLLGKKARRWWRNDVENWVNARPFSMHEYYSRARGPQ